MSQMVGVQATVNVLTGGRYKNVSKEIKAYVKGEYGRAPGKIDPEVQKLVEERAEARKNKDWKRSDELRDQIKAMGYILEDTAAGQKVRKSGV